MDDTLIHFTEQLPVIQYSSREHDSDACPICLVPFEECFQQDAGLTKLEGCGHLFCRADLVQWIQNMHGSCPTCRQPFLDIRPKSESDDESSDGGEYIPEEDDEEEGFADTDGFTSEMEQGDMSIDQEWEGTDFGEDMDWGLTDGEETSEGDMSLGEEVDDADVAVEITASSSSDDLSPEPEETKG
ncbi:hypothetical protein C8J56DRAFT_1047334 [Mycena floridula]|nr:hypothetical protein C8J56DRAFT_1047334 [Mycena floridula]